MKSHTYQHNYRSVRSQHSLHTLLLSHPPVAVRGAWLECRCYKHVFDVTAQCVCVCVRSSANMHMLAEEKWGPCWGVSEQSRRSMNECWGDEKPHEEVPKTATSKNKKWKYTIRVSNLLRVLQVLLLSFCQTLLAWEQKNKKRFPSISFHFPLSCMDFITWSTCFFSFLFLSTFFLTDFCKLFLLLVVLLPLRSLQCAFCLKKKIPLLKPDPCCALCLHRIDSGCLLINL